MCYRLAMKVSLAFSWLLFILRAVAGRKEVFGIVGSSALLDPEYTEDLARSGVVWTFIGRSGGLVTILDYLPGNYKEEPSKQFESRLKYNTSNGFLLLKSLQPSDQGVYTFTVDGIWKWSMDLKLIEPLSEPVINRTFVNGTIELTCRVSLGKASSILWWKDSVAIENSQRYQLTHDNSTLIISEASKSDCGIYFCSVANPVSKKNGSYSLTVSGLSRLRYRTNGLPIAALVVAGFAFTCRIISCFITKMCLQFLEYGLQSLAYICLIILFGFWIFDGEAPKIVVIALVALCLLLTALLTLTACVVIKSETSKIKTYVLKSMAMLTMPGKITVISLSAALIVLVNYPGVVYIADKGCEPAANLQSNLTVASCVSFGSLLAFLVPLIRMIWNKRRSGNQSENPSANGIDKHEQVELTTVSCKLIPTYQGEEIRQSENTVPSEELP